MADRKVCILGGGMSKWGVREASIVDMAQEAAKDCFDDVPVLKKEDVDGLLFASSYCGRRSFQVNAAPVIAERIGIKPTSMCTRVDTLCAGGSSGIILATGLIKAGMADIMIVIGGEKLYTPQRWETYYSELASIDHDWDGAQGIGLPPPFFSMTAQEHMKRYGTTKEQLSAVSVKNRRNGLNNPKGHFQKAVSLEEVMASRPIAPPLGLLDCTPVTDGCAAVILTHEDKAKELSDRPLVYVRGTAQVALHSMSMNWPGEDLTDWVHLRTAAKKAYERARVSPDDIDVAQTHDCFTISEIIEMEDLGFCKKGEGGPFVESGKSDFGGKIPVNTDGGLLACGHPFGGTGIRQAREIVYQLQGRAIGQVEGAKIGLTHNLSGLNVEHTILIYGREP
ncbi:MAG: thiolase family protein [Dehalococcoidales bacterium]|nr:thiolase family protein [Dehalococcoidales bacterium]